jgi:hypothetical protein
VTEEARALATNNNFAADCGVAFCRGKGVRNRVSDDLIVEEGRLFFSPQGAEHHPDSDYQQAEQLCEVNRRPLP